MDNIGTHTVVDSPLPVGATLTDCHEDESYTLITKEGVALDGYRGMPADEAEDWLLWCFADEDDVAQIIDHLQLRGLVI